MHGVEDHVSPTISPWCCNTLFIYPTWLFQHHDISIHRDAIPPSHRTAKLWDQIWWEVQINQPCHPHLGVCYYTKQNIIWMCCHPLHMFSDYTSKVWKAWEIINTLGSCSLKIQCTQSVGPDLVRTTKPPSHHQDWVCCWVKNHMPWICCHPFHMFYMYMGKD